MRYRPQHEAKNYQRTVELTFRIEKAMADKINKEVFGGAEIVAAGSTFTRDTTIANTNTISFQIDQKAALAALQETARRSGAQGPKSSPAPRRLADVLTKIEGSEPRRQTASWPPSRRSGGRGRSSLMAGGLVDGHIWQTCLSPALPKFLYFDDYKLLEGKINLPRCSSAKLRSN